MTGKEMMALLAQMSKYDLEREIVSISHSGKTFEMGPPLIRTGEQLMGNLCRMAAEDLQCEIVAFTPDAAWRIASIEMDTVIVDRINLSLVSPDGGPEGQPDTKRDDLNEAIADIAYLAGERKYYSGNSRADIALFVDLAQKFQAEHKETVWGESLDYIDTIISYAEKHLDCCEHGTPKDELGHTEHCSECITKFAGE